ncbi:MAG: signal transduction histidine kinase [Myxococcota bacterium]
MVAWFSRIAFWFLPKEPDRTPVRTHRLFLLVSLCLAVNTLAGLSAVGYFNVAPMALRIVLFGSFALSFAIPFAIRAGLTLERGATVWSLVLVGAATLFAAYSGGGASAAFAWIIVVPISCSALAGRQVGLLIAPVSALAGAGIILVEYGVGLPESFIPPNFRVIGFLVTALSVPFVMLLSATFTHQIRDLAVADIKGMNHALKQEVLKHEKTRSEVELLQAELLDAARNAGMADVATGVLHNIGNALNSVNVSIGVAEQRLCNTPLDLSRASALLRQSQTIPPDRLAIVADYLDGMSRKGENMRVESVDELRRIRAGAEHIAAVVRAQQAMARSVSVNERIYVRNLLDQAAALVQARMADSGVQLVLDECTDRVVVDRHRVLQIVVNLMSNACDACAGEQPALVMVNANVQEGILHIGVGDNGIGISAERLAKVFQHGFTTKPTGFGFGLHVSALSAKALGGELTAMSDGAGLGAYFQLTVPIQDPSTYDDSALRALPQVSLPP